MRIGPENGSKDHFGENAAEVFVNPADKEPAEEDVDVGLAGQTGQRDRQQNGAEAPDETERSVKDTGAVHPVMIHQPAVQEFDQIAKEGGEDENPDQLIKTETFAKRKFSFTVIETGNARIGMLNPVPDVLLQVIGQACAAGLFIQLLVVAFPAGGNDQNQIDQYASQF